VFIFLTLPLLLSFSCGYLLPLLPSSLTVLILSIFLTFSFSQFHFCLLFRTHKSSTSPENCQKSQMSIVEIFDH
jgi:hypothetical protein